PEYGRIVCHCERVTRGEIRDALAGPLPPADLDGLRRRTRVLNGRCQGFFCAATVAALFTGAGATASAAAPAGPPPANERLAEGPGPHSPRGGRSAVRR